MSRLEELRKKYGKKPSDVEEEGEKSGTPRLDALRDKYRKETGPVAFEDKPALGTPIAKFDKNKPEIKEVSAFDVDPYAPKEKVDYSYQSVLGRNQEARQQGAMDFGKKVLDALALVGKSGDSSLPMNNATVVVNELRDNADAVQQAVDNRETIEAQKQAEEERMQDWANENKFAASAASVVSSPLAMVDYLQQLVEVNAVGHSLPSENLKPAEITQGLREGVSRDWGNGGKFLYNTTMSGVDSFVGGILGGGVPGVGGLILGGGAASYTMNDIKERGGSDQQAIIGGAAAGAFESIFENISLSQLKAFKEMPIEGAKTVFTNLAKGVFTNASEEAATEIANGLFDAFMMQDLASFDLTTPEGRKELAKQVALSALAGGLMGLFFGGAGSVGSYIDFKNNDQRDGAQLLQNALDIKENGLPVQGTEDAATQEETMQREESHAQTTTLTNSQAEKIMTDPEQMAALGINTEGKTKAQVRNEVKAAVMGKDAAQTQDRVSEVEAGRRVSAGEVATAVLGENGSKAFKNTYNTDMAATLDENTAVTSFNTVYKATLEGRTMTEQEQSQTASMPDTLRIAAESSAQLDRQRASQAKYFGENAMLVRDENFKKMHLSSKTVRTLDAIAKVTGTQVRFVEQADGGRANATYGDGVIQIAMDTNDPVMAAFTHEIVHRIRETSPQSYNAMAEFVQKYLGQNASNALVSRYKKAYGTTDASSYTEEMVADAFGTILRDGKALEQFVKDDRTTAQKVLDAIRDLINAIKRALNGKSVELSREQRTAFIALQNELTEMEGIMSKALSSLPVVEKENTATEGGEVKFSRKEDVLALSNVDWMDNFSSIKDQLAKHADEINKMDPVAVVEYAPKSGGNIKSIIADAVAHVGGKSMKNSGVRFLFDDEGINKIDVHAQTDEVRAASLASPYVAKYGKLIAGQKNHENKGLTTLTFAAPVIINGDTVNVGVAIQFTSDGRPRAANVGLQSGGVFKIDKTKAPKGPGSRVNRYGQGTALPTMDAFKESVTHPMPAVNHEMESWKSSLKAEDGDFSEAAKAAIKDAQLAGMMNQGRKDAERIRKAKETTADVRRKRDETIQKLKEHQREQKQKASESRHASDYRRRIERHVADLSRTLRNPTDKKHVPEALRGPVAKLLESINLESKGGAPTKRTQAFTDLKKVYAEIAENLVIDPDLLGGEGTTGLLDDVIAMTDKRISEMNTEELDIVWRAIRAIEASIRTANKAFSAGRFQTIQEAADALRSDNMLKRSKTEWNYIDKLQKLTGVDMLTPEAFFHRLGASGDAIFRMMRNAQDKHIRLMKQVADFTGENLSDVDVRALEKEMHTVNLGGQEVEMSTAQIMELYALMRRQQAMDHLLEGGILPDVVSKRGLKKSAKAEPIHGISADSLFDAISVLTDEQVKIAELLQEYASTVLSDFGNEASMEVYGYRKFNEEHYWPIRSNRQEVKSDIQKDTQVTSVANRGFTKNVKPNANNSVMVGSIFDTFASHASDMATYAAWLGTSEDVNRIRNFVFRAEGQTVGTVKGILDRVHGVNKGQQYLQKLLADIANGVKGVDVSASLTGGLLGNYKAASVGANLRVVIQQPTAILRAFDMIDPKYFISTMNPVKGFERAKKYAPIAQWKDWGYFDIHTGKQMKDVLFASESAVDKVKEAAMWGAGKMDSLSWGILWNAVETEVKDKTELNPGTEAFYQNVAERFSEVIDRTQVVDGILQRSQIMRDPGDLKKMVTAFMGEPTKQYNMLLSAAYDAKQKIPKAKRALVRTGISLATSAIINAAVQSIVDAFRDDDREQNYWEKWLEAFVGVGADDKNAVKLFLDSNIFGAINPLSSLPYIKDVWSVILGYDVRRMDIEAIDKTASAAKNLMKSLKGEGSYTVWNAALSMLSEICKLTGIPLSNVKRDITSLAVTAAVETDSYLMEYRIRKIMYKVPANTTMYYDILYSAYTNDADAYEIIYDDMVKSGLGEDKIRTAMESRMKRDQKVDSVSDLEKRYLSPAQQRSYDAKMSSMEASSLWKRANATQRSVAENVLFELVTGNDKMLDKLEDGARYGVSDTEYALYQMALSMADKPTDSGKYGTYTNSEVEAAIKMLGLSRKESSWLWEAQGKNAKSNPFK